MRILYVLLFVSFGVGAMQAQNFTKFNSVVRNTELFGVDIDLFTFGNVPMIYATCGEFDIKRDTSFSWRMMGYSYEGTGVELDVPDEDYVKEFYTHNFAAIKYERYYKSSSNLLPNPKIVSLYGRLSYATFSLINVFDEGAPTSSSTRTQLSKEWKWTPYLDIGAKVYLGFEQASIYIGSLSFGYILGSRNVHKIARHGHGFYVNYSFDLGFLNYAYGIYTD